MSLRICQAKNERVGRWADRQLGRWEEREPSCSQDHRLVKPSQENEPKDHATACPPIADRHRTESLPAHLPTATFPLTFYLRGATFP